MILEGEGESESEREDGREGKVETVGESGEDKGV